MKSRMIWRYSPKNLEKKTNLFFWGTCAKWAREHENEGTPMVRERVMWVGKLPSCGWCTLRFH